MRQCGAWKKCRAPVKWVYWNGAYCCNECRKRFSTEHGWRRLSVAEQRLVNAGFAVTFPTKISKVEAVRRLLKGVK